MAPPLSNRLKRRVAVHLESGVKHDVIQHVEGIGGSSIDRISKNLKAFGEPTPPAHTYARRGVPLKIHPTARAGLQEFLNDKPWAYQEEMMEYLLDDFGLAVVKSTISKTLKKMGITQKSLRKIADARDPELRNIYFVDVAAYTHDQLVYLDETAANQRSTHRKRGWSALGIVPYIRLPFKREKRWSILPAYCSDGILTYHIFHGGYDGGLFEAFLRYKVLPKCSPFPGPKSILIMDNASIHHSSNIRDLCAEFGVIVLYLPPYSPDLNPIESFFSKLKAWMELAMMMNKGADSAPGYFRHSGIYVPEGYGREV